VHSLTGNIKAFARKYKPKDLMHSISRIIHNRFEIFLPVNYAHFTTTWLRLLYTAGSALANHSSVGATGTI